MKNLFLLAFISFLCICTLNSQTKNELQIGLANPQGKFADDNENNFLYKGSGLANSGIFLGYKLLSPLNSSGLYWTFNLGIMYNNLEKGYKEELEEDLEDAKDYTLQKYINIPMLFGLQYESNITEGMSLFGEAGLGLNILKITNYSYEFGDDADIFYPIEFLESYKPSAQLGIKIGGGIVLGEKYTISLNYLALGSHKVKYEREESYYDMVVSKEKRFEKALPVNSLNISFGIRF